MKVYNKPIEVIMVNDPNGDIRPIRFKVRDEEENSSVVKINKVLSKGVTKQAGKKILRITCMVESDNQEKVCELHFYMDTIKWSLFKI